MTTKEERAWARRAPADASAGFNIFTGHRSSLGSNEGATFSAPVSQIQGVTSSVDGTGERVWAGRESPDASAGIDMLAGHRSSNGGTPFGAPVTSVPEVVTSPTDSLAMAPRPPGRRPPLDTLLIPRVQGSPGSSQVNSLVFEGVPPAARRGSPLMTPTSQGPSVGSSLLTPSSSPLNVRRRASAPNPSQPLPSPLARRGNLQPRLPNSPNTGPWHGRSAEITHLNPRTPSPSDQALSDSPGVHPFGGPSNQGLQGPVGYPVGASVDPTRMRSSPYGRQSMGGDAGQLSQSSIPSTPTRRHTFPNESAGAQDMLRYISAMNRTGSVPASPAVQKAPSKGVTGMSGTEMHPQGTFGRVEPNYGRVGASYVEAGGKVEPTFTGAAEVGVLEDAIIAQHIDRVAALLEHGLSPDGERGSAKSPPLLYAVSTGNERLVKLLLSAGANINGCDSHHYTGLHYAAASGYRGIVKILAVAGANIYAKTDGDLLPIQLTADQAIYDYLSARMISEMEERISPKQGKPSSPRPPARHSSFQRSDRIEHQWNDDNGFDKSGNNTGLTEVGEMQTVKGMKVPGGKVTKREGGGFFERHATGSGQLYGEGLSSNIILQSGHLGPDRQTVLGPSRQASGANVMDWETYGDAPPVPTYQGYEERIFSTNQGSNRLQDERAGFEQSKDVDVWMQDGTGSSNSTFVRPTLGQDFHDRPVPLQRAPSAPAVLLRGMDATQQDFRQNGRPQAQQSSPRSGPLQRAPSAPAELGQEMEEIREEWLRNARSTHRLSFEEGRVAATDKLGNGMLDAKEKNMDDLRARNVAAVPESGDDDLLDVTLPVAKSRFSLACDSMAPSMVQKFRAAISNSVEPSQEHEYAHLLNEKVPGTPQGPETPRQVGECQDLEKSSGLLAGSAGASPSLEKGKEGIVDGRPTSALKGEAKKQKERKKSVTFALVEPSEADLALIREDWHDAARSGCVGCGNAGCEGQCLRPEKIPPVLDIEAASCSSSSSSNSAVPEKLFTNAEPTRTGSFRWTRGELLGEGAYGKVFAGLNQETGELMAVKQLKLDTAAEGQERQFYLAALEREIALYKTMRHKHIVGYINMEQDPESGSLYVFLEYVSGGSIQSMLERFGRFSERLVRVYARQLLLGLEYLHGKKIVHRDIKGGNVLVDADGVVKLADFGASKAFHDPAQTDGFKSIRGSVFWMAPEVIKGDGYGRRADIWSVGCTVVEMLTAVHPWPGMDNTWTAIFHIAKASSGPPVPDTVSPIVKDFLSHCFRLDPKKRPTATEVNFVPYQPLPPILAISRPGEAKYYKLIAAYAYK